MQFVAPISFTEALTKLGARSPIGSLLASEEWAAVPVALRNAAFFSSQVESIRFLQRGKDLIGDFLSGAKETLPNGETALKAGSRQEFVKQLSEFARAEGLGPLKPEDAGTIKDIRSESRLNLIFDVQTRQAYDFGNWKQGQDPDLLNEFPAQRFIRVKGVKSPRDEHEPFEGKVRLKSDLDFWLRINQDFGVPWGPWGWGCGHDVEDVDRDEAEQLGLIAPGQKLEPMEKSFNEHLESTAKGLDPELLETLKEAFGDQVEIEGGAIRWREAA